MTPRARIARLSAVAMLAAVVAGCAQDAPQDTWQPAGSNARQINDLDIWVFSIAGIVGVAVFSVLGFAVWKYRDRGQPIPEQTHGKPALEIGLTILPALILIGIAIPTVGTIMDLNKTDDTECIINVTGQQWWWEVDYPVQDGCGGIEEPIVTSGQMVIEAGSKVLVRGTSRDVIHSWWIPRLNGKRDMVPGRIHTVRLEADEPGIYAGQCTEFCGLSHANMRMEVIAMEPDDFAAWKANQLEAYASPDEGTLAAEGEATFITQCSRCHQVDGLTDSGGELVVARPDQNVWSGAAPNLTNFMTRNTFAGATWNLLSNECWPDVWEADSSEVGAAYLEGVSDSCLNEVELREWLRNAPAKKPMYTDPESLEETDGLPRGMPYLALSEDQIDQLIAYLLERK
ncbi:MAG: cytochrome c oxidase subunit II [Ilumatobacter sp.]|uniref:cytochrome c oxidase subunit II n=1 Tax=Ilumatobacter sp. TaxID=1967498 RepID=UPI001DBB0196|nr:cytochrome c oxidase subunit II [Ilumatobacter sp.]MBT5276564.1 cytochrome c oxidase subunit II [Ilumatobacter sp.]MBT5553872.1 cytochrome c oxidase subunit II [Ilumatobacter sp.]MBT5865548.1 cytochrome c oxidase subunit II [Ilumatobacter sp.]MBT7428875.1 cytochrome c oxidase subunit II [Ilumatobacter sp.]